MSEHDFEKISCENAKKSFFIFDEYVKKITSGIKSGSAREDVENELYCHLEDNYNLNLALGMSHEEAVLSAVEKMGNGETLAYRLENIHSYNPLKAMSSAITTLFFGFALSEFFFTTIFKDVFAVLSLPLIFSALLRFRGVNKKLTAGFHLFNVFALLYLAGVILPIGVSFPLRATLTLTCASFTAKGLFLLLTLSGLYELAEPFIKEGTKKPRLKFCGGFYLLLYLFTAVILSLSEGEKVTISSFVLPLLTIFCYFFTLVQLTRTRKLLWDADGEYGILQGDKKHKITVLVCIASAIFIYAGYSYLSATKEPVKTELVIHDVSESEKQVADETRKKMLSWGVKQEHLDDLPDSEVLKYKDAIYGSFSAHGNQLYDSSSEGYSAHTDITFYTFVMPDEESKTSYLIRMLYVAETNVYDFNFYYRQGFYRTPYNATVLNAENNSNLSPYIGIISYENGRKYKAEPLLKHNMDEDEILKTPKGFEYREERDQRIYYAENFGITTGEWNQSTTVYCLVARMPFFMTPGFNSTADLADKLMEYGTVYSSTGGFTPFHYFSFFNTHFNLYTDENRKLHFGSLTSDEIIA